MTIPNEISLKLQNTLRDLVRDDRSLRGMVFWRKEFVDNPISGASISAWQNSVDFIFRCQKAGLTKIVDYDHYKTQDAIFDDLRQFNPFVYSAAERPGDFAWHGPLVYGTAKLAEIVKRFFKSDDEGASSVNSDFVVAIEQAFADAGVPWSDDPLLPVVP